MTAVDDNSPRNVLVISAEMGEGHNAAAKALTEAIEESWPGCSVERLDTMELHGVCFARAARWSYGFQLKALPWSYEMFYDWLSKSIRFADGAKVLIGAFFGRRLEKEIERRHPDLVISTYPFGSAALDWLRKKRGFSTLTVTYCPAFHVHPLWVYPGIDLHFVMYDSAPEHARMRGFEESMRVGAPPVRRGFGGVSRAEARESIGLPDDAFVVLMTGGAWGLGDIGPGVEALLKMEPAVHVVTVCGKNSALEGELRALGANTDGRLVAYGYVSNMPELMAASNVVVTNGAGVTVLEALRTPRPVVAFAPLAGHGTASTVEMVRRDLAVEARDVPGLVDQVRRLKTDEALLRRMELAVESWVEGKDLQRNVGEIQALYALRHGALNGHGTLNGSQGTDQGIDSPARVMPSS
jgi:UDP-N-acetylglucosamine:LPS N-acetylglucosamine transferase